MSTVWLDSPSTDQPPPSDSSTSDNDKTLVRTLGTPRPPVPAASDVDDSPIVRLVRAHERSHSTQARTPPIAENRCASLPIAVLTTDRAFAEQLRGALDSTTTVTAVESIDEAAALAASGRCPIVVTDLVIARSAIDDLTQRLRAHDPATAIVVAGDRDHSALFVGMQSSGAIDAFLLKPITSGATRVVIEAATRRYRSFDTASSPRQQRSRSQTRKHPARAIATDLESSQTIEAKRPARDATHSIATLTSAADSPARKAGMRPSWSFVALIAIVAAVAVWWSTSQPTTGVDTNALVTKHLALGETALAARRLLDVRDGAAHHYQTVLALDPNNFAAHRGLDSVAHELSKQTQTYMAQRRLPDAAVALERLRELQPNYAELPLLDSQLKVLQDTLVATHASAQEAQAAAQPEPKPTPQRSAPRSAAPREAAPRVASAPRKSEQTTPAVAPESAPTITEVAREERPSVASAVESLTPSIAPPVRPTLPASTESVAPSSAPPATPESVSEERTPTLAKYVPPEYPSEAYARRMEGWIEVSMEITPNGDVLSPRVEDGEKRQLFGRAALVAVRQWKYAPDAARVAGERSRVRLEFRMQE